MLDLIEETFSIVKAAPWSLDPAEIRIGRLDPARDLFSPVSIPLVLSALASQPPPPRTKVRPVLRGGSMESLRVGNGSWILRAYNKELKGGTAGQLRVEAQFRSRRLRSSFAALHGGHITVLEDLTPEKVESLYEGTIEALGYDLPMPIDEAAALAALGWSHRDLVSLVGVLGMQAIGIYAPPSPNTVKSHRDLITRYRSALQGRAGVLHLDWAAGVVVLA